MAENISTDHGDGLVHALGLTGAGGAEVLDWAGVERAFGADEPLWIHLNLDFPRACQWLQSHSDLPEPVTESLTAEQSRPRCLTLHEDVVLFLRGVNLNPGADPEDMVSLRLWCDGTRLVSIRQEKVLAVDDQRQALLHGRGAASIPDLLVELADRLSERMEPVLEALETHVDELEDEVLVARGGRLRDRIAQERRVAIALKRYINPQRDALTRLLAAPNVPWLDEAHRWQLRDTLDQVVRYSESLDAMRERASILQDTLTNRISEQMNRTMYVLSLVAGLFLPLGFLTGLLGINVAGLPGTEDADAFIIVCVVLLGIAALELLIFRRLRFF